MVALQNPFRVALFWVFRTYHQGRHRGLPLQKERRARQTISNNPPKLQVFRGLRFFSFQNPQFLLLPHHMQFHHIGFPLFFEWESGNDDNAIIFFNQLLFSELFFHGLDHEVRIVHEG